jgi:hypothetical protein
LAIIFAEKSATPSAWSVASLTGIDIDVGLTVGQAGALV